MTGYKNRKKKDAEQVFLRLVIFSDIIFCKSDTNYRIFFLHLSRIQIYYFMKKHLILGITLALFIGASSCKSKESAYKAAYMKAQEKDSVENVAVENEVISTPAPEQERVSNERISVVDDDADKLKMFNVIVGSFSVKTNASSLKERLIADGYDAFIARNAQMMYRVVVGSFDTRSEATDLRDAVKMKYSPEFSDAWILINK